MLSRLLVWLSFAATTLVLAAGVVAWGHTAAELRLSMQTLHAAKLTASRGAGDTTDSPYLLVSIVGPRGKASSLELPQARHLTIHTDEALGARPLINLRLQPGDSVRLLVSVLEDPHVRATAESRTVIASGKAIRTGAAALPGAIALLTKQGAHWLGSAELLLTNEHGSPSWRSLECLATCKVLTAPKGDAAGARGVVELSGSGGTYHLQLASQ
jgi:hypothetical protein